MENMRKTKEQLKEEQIVYAARQYAKGKISLHYLNETLKDINKWYEEEEEHA